LTLSRIAGASSPARGNVVNGSASFVDRMAMKNLFGGLLRSSAADRVKKTAVSPQKLLPVIGEAVVESCRHVITGMDLR
jgi:hypothetical protein